MDPEKYDKDLVRTYIKSNCNPYNTNPSDVTIPDDVKTTVYNAYADFYNTLTGEQIMFSDENIDTPENVSNLYLKKYHRDRVYIISGSVSDQIFVSSISKALLEYDIWCEWEACSAHTETERLIGYLKNIEYNKKLYDHRVVYITVAGRSNALSGVVACNTTSPVIGCPPFKDKSDYLVNIHSTLQMPSNTPVITILDPGNVANAIDRMFKF